MNRKVVSLIFGAVFILLLSGIAAAQGPEVPGDPHPPIVEANIGPGFSFQGYLEEENGRPVNGTCTFAFRLFDDLTGGNQLGVTQELRNVNVVDGVFAVVLNAGNQFGDSAFNGQARWLEITVGCGDGHTTLSPRQELLAVPYAQSLRPGAVISGYVPAQPVLDIHQTAANGSASYGLRVRGSDPQIALVNGVELGGLITFDYTWKLGTPPDADTPAERMSFSIASEGPEAGNIGTRLFIEPGGNVGIGTTTPTEQLTVRDQDHQIGIVDHNTGKEWTFNTLDQFGDNFPDRFAIAEDGSTNRLVIAEGGNVGINASNPDHRLSVRDVGHPQGDQIAVIDGSDDKTWTLATYHASSSQAPSTGFGVFEDGQDNRLFIANRGNVGIGEINPQNRLSVRDDHHQLALIDANNNLAPNKTWTLSTVNYGNGFGVYEDGNSDLHRLYIAAGGNVGIGTLDPARRLHVNGDAVIAVNNQPRFVVEPDGDVCIGDC